MTVSCFANKNRVIKILSAVVFLSGLLLIEHHRPLRVAVEKKSRRWLRNAVITAVGAMLLRTIEQPIVVRLSRGVERKQIGLINAMRVPEPFRTIMAICLMDYTLYIWHALVHKVPLLWRFHSVHHADLDMDVTTANRFHFGELGISIIWRALQVVSLGVNPRALKIWQYLLTVSILFHHSNIRLPLRLEQLLGVFFVTPRMHEIHHSVNEAETNSNFSSGLSIWDWLHNTHRLPTAERKIIGLCQFRNSSDVALNAMLLLPFKRVVN